MAAHLPPSLSASASQLSEEAYTEYSYSETGSVDTLEDLLRRFTLDFSPEYVLKLRHRTGPAVLGADVSHSSVAGETVLAAVAKPSSPSLRWLRRLKVDSQGMVTLRSRKLRWWVFTLDLEGHANPLPGRRSTSMSFRVATKWDVARGQIKNKRRVGLGDTAEARVHWAINYNLPEIEGSFGAAARHVEREVHADVGYAHASIPKLELVVWPRSKRPAARLPAGSEEEEEAAGAGQGSRGSSASAAAGVGLEPLAAGGGGGDGGGAGTERGDEELLPSYLTGQPGAAEGGASGAPGRPRPRAKDLTQLSSHTAALSLSTLELFSRWQQS